MDWGTRIYDSSSRHLISAPVRTLARFLPATSLTHSPSQIMER